MIKLTSKLYPDAIESFERALQYDQKNVYALAGLGDCYRRQKDYAKALEYYNEALEINMDHMPALNQRAVVFSRTHQYTLAERDWSYLLALDPDSAPALNGLGTVCLANGELDEAFAYFNKALEANRHFALALNNRAVIYVRRNQHDLAFQDLDNAISNGRGFALPHFNRANLYTALGKIEDALHDYELYFKKYVPEDDEEDDLDERIRRIDNLGLKLSYNGDYKNAIRAFKMVQRAQYDNYSVQYNLAVAMVRYQPKQSSHTSSIGKARKQLEELLKTSTDDSRRATALYGLAGLVALRGEKTAIEGLKKAVELSSHVIEWARQDAAWHDLRGYPEFESILNQSWS
ncbi:MAG: tetratricopeptide repeat protein [Chloroflexi bacterium]|nr:tetratricopeptide repeat protein [Chloroflexota bacterium]